MLRGRWEEIAIGDHYQQNRISQKVNALLVKPRKKKQCRISKQTWPVRISCKVVHQQNTSKMEKQGIIEKNIFSSFCYSQF